MGKEGQNITGAEILMEQLIHQGVDTIFGYPGGQIMPTYDKLAGYRDKLRHILVRHEQGAIHAAQGYARTKGFPGVVLVTSGPGATNVITGVADALIDSTSVVVIAGQVGTAFLGTDAFQETDLIGMTTPITKWAYQIRRPEDVAWAVARAFYVASTGRPGPVVLDLTKDAQIGSCNYHPQNCNFIRSYVAYPKIRMDAIEKAVDMIDASKKPFVVYGQGILASGAEKQLEAFLEKADCPAGSTLLGLSALDSSNPHYMGMLGMHGNIAPNYLTQNCDLLIAVGMRFDDRVTGKLSTYAKQAKIIHIDIDEAEIGKNVPVTLGILGDASQVLGMLTERIARKNCSEWLASSGRCREIEEEKVIRPEIAPETGVINPGEVIAKIAELSGGKAIVVTDVGQNQMLGARYSRFCISRSFVSSGGLGTMGFGLPAAIGAKIGSPDRIVCAIVGDGGLQMTIEEFGTILQEHTGVKIVLLNNNWLGNVRQWQELFHRKVFSETRMINPDFCAVAAAYGIDSVLVEKREDLMPAIEKMLSDDRPFLLNVHTKEDNMVFPMIPPGKSVDEIMINTEEWFDYGE